MLVGVPKEIKAREFRVGLVPSSVAELVRRGHEVLIEAQAGAGIGASDDEYIAVGASIAMSAADVFAKADMIVKVKEPIEPEYKLIKKDQLVFTYFHFASYEPLTKAMMESGSICLAYETVEKEDRSLPLLVPMSEVAGRMSVQEGAKYLEKPLIATVFGEKLKKLHGESSKFKSA